MGVYHSMVETGYIPVLWFTGTQVHGVKPESLQRSSSVQRLSSAAFCVIWLTCY